MAAFDTSTDKDYLLSEKPHERVFGRLIATSAGDEIGNWVAAELERGSAFTDIMLALSNFFVNIHSSVAGSMLDKDGCAATMKMLQSVCGLSYVSTSDFIIQAREAEAS